MDNEQRDLLLTLSYLYLSSGREPRALPLLLLVSKDYPDDQDCLRALAHAYTATQQGELALVVLDRLDQIGAEAAGVGILRARALHAAGRLEEARAQFRSIEAA